MPDQDTLPTPAEVTGTRPQAVDRHRATIDAVLARRDRRLLVVAGPCSVHDPAAALDYARLLADAAERYADDRVPRTRLEGAM